MSKEEVVEKVSNLVEDLKKLEQENNVDNMVEYFGNKYPELVICGFFITPSRITSLLTSSPKEILPGIISMTYDSMFKDGKFNIIEIMNEPKYNTVPEGVENIIGSINPKSN